VTIDNVRIVSTPGHGIQTRYCNGVSLHSVTVAPEYPYLLSSTADALHMRSTRGNVMVEDCYFEGSGDDCLNLTQPWAQIIATDPVAKKITVQTNSQYSQGYIFNAQNTLRCVDIGIAVELGYVVLQNTIYPPINPPWDLYVNDTGVPASFWTDLANGGYLTNVSFSPDSVQILGSTFTRNRARGLAIHCDDVLVDNCSFIETAREGLNVASEVMVFNDGSQSRNVVVQNCLFDGCNPGKWGLASVSLIAATAVGYYADAGALRNISLLNNTIRNTPLAGIYVSSVDGVTVSNNVFSNISYASDPARAFSQYVMYFQNSTNGVVTFNYSHQPYNLMVGEVNVSSFSYDGNVWEY